LSVPFLCVKDKGGAIGLDIVTHFG
jgi:hypothetical protein